MNWTYLSYTDRLAVEPLVEALIHALLATPDLPLGVGERSLIARADERGWQRALDTLEPHKLFPLLSHQLNWLGLKHHLPEQSCARIETVHRQVRALNTFHLFAVANVLRAADQRNELLLLMKGMLFADSYYPDFSTRPMGDIDVACAPGRGEVLFDIMERAGFKRANAEDTQEDARQYLGPNGTACDAHTRLAMFEAQPFASITQRSELRLVRGVDALVFEPNAMLAHLVTHLDGHYEDLGPVFLWLLDFAFVLRKSARLVDAERVRKLLANERRYGLFLRILGLLHGLGEVFPRPLAERAMGVPPLSLGQVLRQRRMIPWGLPGTKGWARVLGYKFAHQPRGRRPELSALDLILWPLDVFSAHLTPYLAR